MFGGLRPPSRSPRCLPGVPPPSPGPRTPRGGLRPQTAAWVLLIPYVSGDTPGVSHTPASAPPRPHRPALGVLTPPRPPPRPRAPPPPPPPPRHHARRALTPARPRSPDAFRAPTPPRTRTSPRHPRRTLPLPPCPSGPPLRPSRPPLVLRAHVRPDASTVQPAVTGDGSSFVALTVIVSSPGGHGRRPIGSLGGATGLYPASWPRGSRVAGSRPSPGMPCRLFRSRWRCRAAGCDPSL